MHSNLPAGGERDMTTSSTSGLMALHASLGELDPDKIPPVERWNPPYCGDIGMRIAADGTWFYQNSPIGRAALVKLFSRVLRRDEDDQHYLVTPVEKVSVEVEDAPFQAVAMQVEGKGREQAIGFRTNVGDVTIAGPEHAMRFARDVQGGLRPYVHVRGRLEARLTRALYYDLVEIAVPAEHDDADWLGVWSQGLFFPMGPMAEIEPA